jgi:2-polyprenyl-3-methyl-5-hydroxy-6-metoxy-1,4-benzoquinol methylase
LHWNSFFDIILTSHVIEHFVYPVDAIRKISDAVRLGGCWITQHPDASVFPGVKYHAGAPKEHLQLFDANNLVTVTTELGLKRVMYIQEEPGQSVSVYRKIKNSNAL